MTPHPCHSFISKLKLTDRYKNWQKKEPSLQASNMETVVWSELLQWVRKWCSPPYSPCPFNTTHCLSGMKLTGYLRIRWLPVGIWNERHWTCRKLSTNEIQQVIRASRLLRVNSKKLIILRIKLLFDYCY